jgi:hypothetical protein
VNTVNNMKAIATRLCNKLLAAALRAVLGAALPALLVVSAGSAHADNALQSFQSPSGNISCSLLTNTVQCDIGERDWSLPGCAPDRAVSLMLGVNAPTVKCHTVGSLLAPGIPNLDYGQMRVAGAISCRSEPSGMRCTNTNTGRYFNVSVAAYQLG